MGAGVNPAGGGKALVFRKRVAEILFAGGVTQGSLVDRRVVLPFCAVYFGVVGFFDISCPLTLERNLRTCKVFVFLYSNGNPPRLRKARGHRCLVPFHQKRRDEAGRRNSLSLPRCSRDALTERCGGRAFSTAPLACWCRCGCMCASVCLRHPLRARGEWACRDVMPLSIRTAAQVCTRGSPRVIRREDYSN